MHGICNLEHCTCRSWVVGLRTGCHPYWFRASRSDVLACRVANFQKGFEEQPSGKPEALNPVAQVLEACSILSPEIFCLNPRAELPRPSSPTHQPHSASDYALCLCVRSAFVRHSLLSEVGGHNRHDPEGHCRTPILILILFQREGLWVGQGLQVYADGFIGILNLILESILDCLDIDMPKTTVLPLLY